MKISLLIIGLCTLIQIGNVQASTYRFDGALDLYNGSTLVDSTSVTGDFLWTGVNINTELTGSFTGILLGSPVTGDLTIPTNVGNPVLSPLAILWNGNNLNGELLLDVDVISLDLLLITSLDSEDDGVPGSIFTSGPYQSTSLALSGQFTAVPLPSALWLFSSGIALGIITRRRRSTCKNS